MFQDLLGPVEQRRRARCSRSRRSRSGRCAGRAAPWPAPMLAVAAASVLLGLAHVGPPVEQLGGQPGGHRRRQLLLVDGAAARGSGPGCGPSSTESSFSFCAISALEVVGDDLDAVQLRLRLAQVHLGRDAALEAVLARAPVLAPRRDRAPRDLEPAVEVAQLEVGARHVRHQRRARPRAAPPRWRGTAPAAASVARRMRPKKSISQDRSARRRVDRVSVAVAAPVGLGGVHEAPVAEAQARRRRRSTSTLGQRSALVKP